MSLKKRLEEKSAGLSEGLGGMSGLLSRPPKTGPGQMLALRGHLDESASRSAELEKRLEEFEGAQPVRLLDSTTVVFSKWSNRHQLNFEGAAFGALVEEIRSAGVNVQPIKVRPIVGNPAADFEVVFGHRRLRACQSLGLPVRAMVEELSDAAMFAEMDRENRQRADLSAWEQGVMYRRAIEENLFPSLRQMAEKLGIDAGNASKAMALARLPQDVVNAFGSPLDLQFRWAGPLSEALQKDPEGVVARARAIAALKERPSSASILAELLGTVVHDGKGDEPLIVSERQVGTIRRSRGKTVIAFEKGVLNERSLGKLKTFLNSLLVEKG